MKKIISLSFLILLVISAVALISFCFKMNALINDSSLSLQTIQLKYSALQKQTSVLSIVLFIILLLIGFFNFYTSTNAKYIVLANLLYIPITLYNYASLNFNFYKLQGIEPVDSSGFWLILFIGIFYIIGAIVISVIGFFTIRNLVKRNK